MEWCLNDQIFRTMRQMTFEPSIDLFTSGLNVKVGLLTCYMHLQKIAIALQGKYLLFNF